MKKILLVFGTRPEAIKMCPVLTELRKHRDIIDTKVCVSGQHREMLDQILRIFDVTPEYDLNIMKKGQDLFDVTSLVLTGMRDVLKKECPDMVLVHGDTTTSMGAALAAYYERIPVGHVEAGLRTRNINSPWPEEVNRQITARIATYHFAPTRLAANNLKEEHVQGQVFITGNTVIDALQQVVRLFTINPSLADEQKEQLKESGYDINRSSDSEGRRKVLITGHRRENFGEGFHQILTAIKDLADKYKDVDFVYPMHLNPNVREPISAIFGEGAIARKRFGNIYFIEPLGYLSFVYLMSSSHLILTDSGGIQEEAPSLGKPVLVMRNTTERPEAVKAGTVRLVGANHDRIVKEACLLLDDKTAYQKMSNAINPYGDGKAAERIIKILIKLLG